MKLRYGKTYIGRNSDTLLYLGCRIKRQPDGTYKSVDRTVESLRRSRKRLAEKRRIAEEAMALVNNQGCGQKKEATSSSALLCYARGLTKWYAMVPNSVVWKYQNSNNAKSINVVCENTVLKALHEAEASTNALGVKYVKVIGMRLPILVDRNQQPLKLNS